MRRGTSTRRRVFDLLSWATLGLLASTSGCSSESAGSPSSALPPRAIGVGASGFVDPSGRHVLLRGVNVRATGLMDAIPSDTPPAPFDASDCEAIARDFGMNVVRLTLSWSLVEPQRGQYDTAYLDRARDVVDACEAVGVSTLLDLHQDGYSKYVGVDGAPLWAHPEPLPPADMSAGGSGDPTRTATTAAFDFLFAEGSPAGEAFGQMLSQLVNRFGQRAGVVGIEILNEPYALLHPDLLFGFYARMLAAMRSVPSNVPIFVEPSGERNILDHAMLPATLPFDPSGVVYAPHLYTGVFAQPWVLGDRARIEASVDGMVAEAGKLGMALFVGEWGGPDDPATGRPWSEIAVDVLDGKLASWAHWSYDERSAKCAGVGPGYCTALYVLKPDPAKAGAYVRTGAYQPDAVALYARPFPRAIGGTLDSFAYDASSRRLGVQGTLRGEHELSVPALIYPAGAEARCDGALTTTAPAIGPGAIRVSCDGSELRLDPAP